MADKEIWETVKEYPNYEVSNLGRVRNKNTKRIKTVFYDNDGYQKVSLVALQPKHTVRKTVHRLVAEAFIPSTNYNLQVNHINGIKDDNRADNLEWVTGSQNVKHAYDAGLRKPSGGRGKIRPVKVLETGLIYKNLHECAKAINSDSGNISKCLHGQFETVKGFHLEYADSKSFLYDYQMEAVKKMKNGCILNGGVGTGKSRTGLYYYFSQCGGSIDPDYIPMTNPKNLLIITTAQKRNLCEWEGELANYRMSTNPEANLYDNTIVVDSWNNIKKYENLEDWFILFDEDRVTGSGAWVKAFLKMTKKNDWIILSATAGDVWNDYVPVFIANGFFRNRTEFNRKHVIFSRFAKYPKIDRYYDTGVLQKYRRQILIPMKLKRHTIQHHEDIWCDYDKERYKLAGKDRWDPFKNEPIRDAGALCYIWRKIVNSDCSRLLTVQEIAKKHPRVIIFYSFDYELELLRTLYYGENVIISEYNGHRHDSLPTSERWVYLVNYAAGNCGWNCTSCDTIIFFSQNYSYKVMEQATGRIDRLNTPFTDLWYYHLKSRSGIDLAISRALAEKKNFNEGKFVKW